MLKDKTFLRIFEWKILRRIFSSVKKSDGKLSVASPTSQLILQLFPCFTYITTHSPSLLLLYLRHSSFSNPSIASPTDVQARESPRGMRCSGTILRIITSHTWVHAFSLADSIVSTFLSRLFSWLDHSTSQFILQPFFCFSYVTSSSLNSPGEPHMLHQAGYLLITWYRMIYIELIHFFL